MTSSGTFIPEIDGLRFVALCSVFVYHVAGYTVEKGGHPFTSAFALWYGQFGVQAFFAVSGFILAVPFARHYLEGRSRPSLRKYFLRRVTRLEPPYILNLLLIAVLRAEAGGRSVAERLAASLTYTHNVIYGSISTINGVAWSLEIEVQFYILAPLIFSVFALRSAPRRRALLVILAAFAIAVQAAWPTSRIRLSLAGQAQYFLAGVLLADLYVSDPRRHLQKTVLWDILSVAAWALAAFSLGDVTLRRILFPAAILVAYLGAFRGRFASALFSNRFLTVIGGMCYTFYLYHQFIISAVGRFTRPLMPAVLPQAIVLGFVVTVACSVLFLFTERPFMHKEWPQSFAAWLRDCPSRIGLRTQPVQSELD